MDFLRIFERVPIGLFVVIFVCDIFIYHFYFSLSYLIALPRCPTHLPSFLLSLCPLHHLPTAPTICVGVAGSCGYDSEVLCAAVGARWSSLPPQHRPTNDSLSSQSTLRHAHNTHPTTSLPPASSSIPHSSAFPPRTSLERVDDADELGK